MTRLTVVCTSCTAGWEIDEGQDTKCSRCGKPGTVRAGYTVVDLGRAS